MMAEGSPVLAGITNWGYGCQKGRPLGIHTKTSTHISWIVNKGKFLHVIDFEVNDFTTVRFRSRSLPMWLFIELTQLRVTNFQK